MKATEEPQGPTLPILWGALLASLVLVNGGCRHEESGATAGADRSPEESPPQTVVLITVDTLRADAVSLLPSRPHTTPFLAELASQGVTFVEAYSTSSWTPPAMSSLFTSRYPSSHGVERGVATSEGVARQPVLPASIKTLAECFKEAGYVTVGVPSNRHLMAELGFSQGFDHYYDEAEFQFADRVNLEVATQLAEAFGPDWRQEWKRHKVFLWIHYFDPHAPYEPRLPWITRYAPEFANKEDVYPANLTMRELRQRYPQPGPPLRRRIWALYRSEVSYLDQKLRELSAELGLEEPDVLWVLTADHGEEIVDHGNLGHGNSLFQEVVRVPMLIRWPARFGHRPRLIADPVSLIDIYPTLVELAELSEPAGLEGRSLAATLRGEASMELRPVFFELHPPRPALAGVLDNGWKLVQSLDPGWSVQLFHLTVDPWEQDNLQASGTDMQDRLQERLRDWTEALAPPPADLQERDIDEETVEELRALGYVP